MSYNDENKTIPPYYTTEEMNPIIDMGELEETGIDISPENMEKVIKDFKNSSSQAQNIRIDNTIAGECSGCARCCQAILPIGDKEIQRIKSYIGKNKIKPINRHGVFDTKFINICPFLNLENRCMIYPVRPEICSWFICSEYKNPKKKYFNHFDKIIRNFYEVFLKDTVYPCPEDNILKMNASYTASKKKAASNMFKKK